MASDAYRNALSAVWAPFENARDRALARGAQLSAASRRALPSRLKKELEQRERELGKQAQTVQEVLAAEEGLGPYEQCLAAAVEWDKQRKYHRQRTARRRRWAKRAGALGLLVLTPSAVRTGGTAAERHQAQAQQCLTDDVCREWGRCEATWGAALPGAENFDPWRHCVAPDCTWACRRFGECHRALGSCVAADEKDCHHSDACQQDGKCTLGEGSCIVGNQADCESSQGCREHGRCTPAVQICIAKLDSDCLRAECCTRYGRCRPENEACVVGDPHPKPCADECRESGRCELVGGRCAAISDADCAFSEDCDRWGRCGAEQGRCVANRTVYCRQSLACTLMSRCHARDGECYRRARE